MSEFKEISTKNLHKSIKRLTLLADYLRDNVKDQRFELESFIEHSSKPTYGPADVLKEARKDLQEGFCGTTACAIGHACMMPEFQKKGLKVRVLPSYGNEFHLTCSYKDKENEIHTDFDAAVEFFKISEYRALQLFSGDGYSEAYNESVPKRKVVKAIRDYVYRAKKHLDKRLVAAELSEIVCAQANPGK